jgi:hypothetical protein
MTQKKAKMGVRGIVITATVFTILGAVFSTVSISCGFLFAAQHQQNNDALVLTIVFTCIGLPLLFIGILLTIIAKKKKDAVQKLIDEGNYVMADVIDITPNMGVEVNGMPTYILMCSYVDPVTNYRYSFQSRNLTYEPKELAGTKIRVYIDKDDISHYYVDVDSGFSENIDPNAQ